MILNEKLFNNKILTEKFSDSMPKWLQSRMVFTKPNISANKKDDYKKKGYDIDFQGKPYYAPRGDKRSIFTLFNKSGIDINNANFIEGDIPTSPRDPRLKEPNIPIFLLEGENYWNGNIETLVYAKGINDEELINFSDVFDKKLRYVPMKTLLSHCKAFCYLDTTDSSNYLDANKVQGRIDNKKFELNDPFRRFTPEEQQKMWRNNFDKSGHLINPDILKNRLSEYKAGNYQKILDRLYKKISNIKTDFAQIYVNADLQDFSTDTDIRDIFEGSYGLNSKLISLIEDYNDLVKEVQRIVNDSSLDEENKKRSIIYTFKYDGARLESNIKSLELRAERVLSVDLDWY